MADKEPKPTTWPWIITACMMPLILGGLLAIGYMQGERKRHAGMAEAAITKFEDNVNQHKALMDRMSTLIALSGVGSWSPDAGTQNIEPEPIPAQPDEFTPMMTYYKEAQPKVQNSAPNSIAQMRAEARALNRWRADLEQHLAFMLYGPEELPQLYTLDSFFDASAVSAVEDEAQVKALIENLVKLRRPDLTADGNIVRPEVLRTAYNRFRQQEATPDPRVSLSIGPNMETIVRLQDALIAALSNYSKNSAFVLWSEVDAADPVKAQSENLKTRVGDDANVRDSGTDAFSKLATGMNQVQALLDAARNGANSIKGGAVDLIREFDDAAQLYESDMESLMLDYQNIINGANRDLQLLKQLLDRYRKISDYDHLRWSAKPDGKLTMVKNDTRVAHINLGSADKVHTGQRFEVWRTSGAGELDERIGMVEVIRTLNAHNSLCTILEERSNFGPTIELRQNDILISRIWDNGQYLRTAMAGTLWGGTFTFYGKDRLKQMLAQVTEAGGGMEVSDDISVATQLVILGDGRKPDKEYQEKRGTINFEEITEDLIRLYVDPR